MTALTKVKEQGMLLIELSDEKGHSNRELTAILKYKSRVSTLLKELEKQGMAYHEIRHTTNDKTKGKEYDEHAYFIGPENPTTSQERLDVFRSIFQECTRSCGSDLQEKFLASEYVNNLLKEVGIISVYNIIKANLHDESFKKLASEALLNQPNVVEEYKNQLKITSCDDNIRQDANNIIYDECLPYLVTDNLTKNDLIGILSNYDQLAAIGFYRRIINNGYSKIFKEFASGCFKSEPINEFIDLDVYLSPFTSYPKNIPSDLLLKRPYERIYDDAYILSESDREKFIRRAYIVYSHFAEILFAGCIDYMRCIELYSIDIWQSDEDYHNENMEYYDKIDLNMYDDRQNYLKNIKKYIQTTIKLAIYHWNIASDRFDTVNAYLKPGNYRIPSKYHILTDDTGIQIIDLKDGKRSKVMYNNVSLLPGPRDPFASLWPCKAFKEFDLDTKTVTYNEILEFMKSNLKQLDDAS